MSRLLLSALVCVAFVFTIPALADDERPNDNADRRAPAGDADGRRGDARQENARNDGRRGDRAAAASRDEAAGRDGRQPATAEERTNAGRRRGDNAAADAGGRGVPGAAIRERLRAEVNERMRNVAGRGETDRLQQEDPEMFALVKTDTEMEAQTRTLVDQYHRAANDTDREQIRGKLTAVVENHFAVRQQRRELEVKRLEVQLERLRSGLKKRTEERQKLIDEHLHQLLGSDEAGF